MSDKILQTERKQLSPELTIVWYWFDKIDENPLYRFGTDENIPRCGLYENGKLISTVSWNRPTVTLEMVQSFLKFASDFQKLPCGLPDHIPESI